MRSISFLPTSAKMTATITQTAATTRADHSLPMYWPSPHHALTEKDQEQHAGHGRPGEQADALARAGPGLPKLRLGQRKLLLHQSGDIPGEVAHHLADAATVLGLQGRTARLGGRRIRGRAWIVAHRVAPPV